MPLREDLLVPIPGNSPGGVSLRYDPITDKIKEARREDLDVPQGDWKSTLKVADYPAVIKLAGEAIATRSKDLQLAVWLVDAHVRREGFAILTPCFKFLRDLQDQFWDSLYPEISDGDLEVRVAPLEWLGVRMEDPLRMLSITSNGLSLVKFKESRVVGYEAGANTDEKRKARNKLIEDGKLPADVFDQAVDETSKAFLEKIAENIEGSLIALEELNNFCNDKYSDYSPSFVKTRTALEDIAHTVSGFIKKKGGSTPMVVATPEPEPQAVSAAPAPAAAAQPAPVQQAAPPPPPPPPQVVMVTGMDPSDMEDAIKRLGAIARFLRKADVYDISPYLILRGKRWGEIRYNGPEIDSKMMFSPPDEFRTDLAKYWGAGDWDKVLETTEAAMELPCGRCWLDLQRYAVKALEKKGQWFAFVAGAIRTGVRGLITDLPGLLHMNMRDGSPTADEETRTWIDDEVMAGISVSVSAPAAAHAFAEPEPEPEAAPIAAQVVYMTAIKLEEAPPPIEEEDLSDAVPSDVFEEAIQTARKGRAADALDLISKKLATERSGRGRFKRRVQLAHLLMAGGHEAIAYPILEQLTSEIEQRRLEEWEVGEGLAYPISLLLRCLASNGGEAEIRKQLYSRVCRLDPVRALDCPH